MHVDKRIIVHIGYPKCASTYLQKLVFPMAGNFAWMRGSFEERALIYKQSMDPKQLLEIVNKKTRFIDNNKHHHIISSETYVELPFIGFEKNANVVARLKDVDLTQYSHKNEVICENLFRVWPEAYILIIIREPLQWAISRYDHWYRRHLVNQSINTYLDSLGASYDKLYELYAERFSKEHVRVVPYEWLCNDPTLFIRSITDFINPEIKLEIPNKRINSKPRLAADVEYRRFHYKLKHGNRTRPQQVFWHAIENISPLLKPYFFIKYRGEAKKSTLSEETIQRLLPQLAVSNLRLQEMTGLNIKELGYYL